MERKSDIVRSLVASGKYRPALKIAKGFRLGISRDDSDQMTRGYECMVHPGFYGQLGYDEDDEIRKGIQVVLRLYGQEV